MKRNSSRNGRNSGHYNVALLNHWRERFGLTVHGFAIKYHMNRDTARHLFNGTASYKQVQRAKQIFKLDWAMVHDLNLSTEVEFNRAALKLGDSRSVRRADVYVGASARSV